MRLFTTQLTICLAIGLCAGTSIAAAADRPDHRRQGPPPEAFEACATAAENQQCNITLADSEAITGICLTPPRGEQLLCVPDSHLTESKESRGRPRD